MKQAEEHINEDLLMLKYIAGETNAEENSDLLVWLKANPHKLKDLNELRALEISLKSSSNFNSFSADSALHKFEKSLPKKKQIPIRKLMIYASSIAASLLLFFSVQFYLASNKDSVNIIAISPDTVKEVILADNSLVTLNSKSILSASDNFNKKNRTVYLKGEAFFDVSHNAEKPFIVNVDELQVKVLGTAFNIFTDTVSKKIIVTVRRGKVAVSNNDKTLILEKGQQSTFSISNKELILSKQDITNSDSWKTGQIDYENAQLPEVVQSLNKNFSTNYTIGSDELKEIKLNASFSSNEGLEEITKVLIITLGVEIKNENNRLVLYKTK